MTSITGKTLEGVAAAVDKVATEQINSGGITLSPAMAAAYEAVIGAIEQKAGRNASVSAALSKVRLACGLQPKEPATHGDSSDKKSTSTTSTMSTQG